MEKSMAFGLLGAKAKNKHIVWYCVKATTKSIEFPRLKNMRHCESETPVTDIFPEIILLSKKSICLPTKAKIKLKIKIFAYTPTLSKKLGYEIKFFKKLCLGSYSLQILSSNLP